MPLLHLGSFRIALNETEMYICIPFSFMHGWDQSIRVVYYKGIIQGNHNENKVLGAGLFTSWWGYQSHWKGSQNYAI